MKARQPKGRSLCSCEDLLGAVRRFLRWGVVGIGRIRAVVGRGGRVVDDALTPE